MVVPNKDCRWNLGTSGRLSIVSTTVSTRLLTSGIILIQEKQVWRESLTEVTCVEVMVLPLSTKILFSHDGDSYQWEWHPSRCHMTAVPSTALLWTSVEVMSSSEILIRSLEKEMCLPTTVYSFHECEGKGHSSRYPAQKGKEKSLLYEIWAWMPYLLAGRENDLSWWYEIGRDLFLTLLLKSNLWAEGNNDRKFTRIMRQELDSVSYIFCASYH